MFLLQALDVLAGREDGFVYVENVTWVKKEINNKFTLDPDTFFQHSKMTLLVCRRVRVLSSQSGAVLVDVDSSVCHLY